MANVDLRQIYRKDTDKVSPVDSRIVLNKNDGDDIIYSDLQLDLEFSEFKRPGINTKEANKDLLIITNLEAVKTSLKNILNTSLNSRLLNPDVDFNLQHYLFEPLNPNIAYFIGYDLCTRMSLYEPRVVIDNINVALDYDNSTYIVTLVIRVPTLNATISLSSVLSKEGYYFA